MKDYVDVKIDNLEARFLCELLYERYHKLIKQRPELIKKKYSLITSIVINHRRIMEGDRPAFFGLVTHTVDGLIEKNKHLYKEMSDRDEVIRHNEVVLETQICVLLNRLISEFEFKQSEIVTYIPIEETLEYKQIRKYSILKMGLPENSKDDVFNEIISRYFQFGI